MAKNCRILEGATKVLMHGAQHYGSLARAEEPYGGEVQWVIDAKRDVSNETFTSHHGDRPGLVILM